MNCGMCLERINKNLLSIAIQVPLWNRITLTDVHHYLGWKNNLDHTKNIRIHIHTGSIYQLHTPLIKYFTDKTFVNSYWLEHSNRCLKIESAALKK